jgi:hypothetical protein
MQFCDWASTAFFISTPLLLTYLVLASSNHAKRILALEKSRKTDERREQVHQGYEPDNDASPMVPNEPANAGNNSGH